MRPAPRGSRDRQRSGRPSAVECQEAAPWWLVEALETISVFSRCPIFATEHEQIAEVKFVLKRLSELSAGTSRNRNIYDVREEQPRCRCREQPATAGHCFGLPGPARAWRHQSALTAASDSLQARPYGAAQRPAGGLDWGRTWPRPPLSAPSQHPVRCQQAGFGSKKAPMFSNAESTNDVITELYGYLKVYWASPALNSRLRGFLGDRPPDRSTIQPGTWATA